MSRSQKFIRSGCAVCSRRGGEDGGHGGDVGGAVTERAFGASVCAARVPRGASSAATSESTRPESTRTSAPTSSASRSERQWEVDERPQDKWRGVEAADADVSGSSGFSEAVFSHVCVISLMRFGLSSRVQVQ